jgi:hypothetical protein
VEGIPVAAILLILAAPAAGATPLQDSRVTVAGFVAQIQKADYEGDRPALHLLFAKLEPLVADPKLASRVRYWRGFALWRRAINGFNESDDPKDLQKDLELAVAEFRESSANDHGSLTPKSALSPA